MNLLEKLNFRQLLEETSQAILNWMNWQNPYFPLTNLYTDMV